MCVSVCEVRYLLQRRDSRELAQPQLEKVILSSTLTAIGSVFDSSKYGCTRAPTARARGPQHATRQGRSVVFFAVGRVRAGTFKPFRTIFYASEKVPSWSRREPRRECLLKIDLLIV